MYDTWTLLPQVIDEQNDKKEKVQWVAKDCSKLIEQKMEDENNKSNNFEKEEHKMQLLPQCVLQRWTGM